MTEKLCCTPARGAPPLDAPAPPEASDTSAPLPTFVVAKIPGGDALVGTNDPVVLADEEGPCRKKRIKPFLMMQCAVTNAEFAHFIQATGYVTEAERFGWSFVFASNVPASYGPTDGVQGAEWWRRVEGATWAAPNGPGTQADCLPDHPVVHCSWNDAQAFAAWAGGRLPTEAEWEHAARGGLGDAPFPWGYGEPNDESFQPCNIWQGQFPHNNTAQDGYHTTAPAKSFEPNGYGLYNMCGNAWEWTADPFKLRGLSKTTKERAAQMKGYKVIKGGSYLCHKSYCFRYRIPARTGTSPDSSTAHQGLRLVFDLTG